MKERRRAEGKKRKCAAGKWRERKDDKEKNKLTKSPLNNQLSPFSLYHPPPPPYISKQPSSAPVDVIDV
jgi:hypothetical protein